MKVNIIDSIMGSGKTSWALQHIEEAPADEKFIYITPFLSEIERVKTTVKTRKFIEPNNANEEGRKLRSLKELIADGYDIAATHSLFQSADDELIDLLEGSGYTLILDEVMNVIEKAKVKEIDIQTMLKSGLIEIDETTNRVIWKSVGTDGGRFEDIRLYCLAGNLFQFRGKFLLWAFPPRVFRAFERVTVMTYLFSAQIQRYYYDLHGIEYEYKAVKKVGERFELTEYEPLNEQREKIMELIDLYEGRLNDVGDRNNAFGASWLRNASSSLQDKIKRSTYNFFKTHVKSRAKENLWTTLKEKESRLGGDGYKKSFIPLNMRATNDYSDRRALAYLFNRFMDPYERSFFEDNGVTVDQDLLAVSDLLQWVYRSRIRNGESIHLYLPSSRMRILLKSWGNYEI
ncbi:hypothetical protein [Halalkalibacterium halodurans]|uniref:Uncharacterized protein n=1 Tax=Halalkalibacterium halodurans TaxID=86665 RepID=A0A0M0KJ89_ALKHA|nr:hypothetical protein [Halalkalibacterium halodurans]TPE68947.1 hypothetical protein AMD02_010895 [Halalkalibacterium halodurans]